MYIYIIVDDYFNISSADEDLLFNTILYSEIINGDLLDILQINEIHRRNIMNAINNTSNIYQMLIISNYSENFNLMEIKLLSKNFKYISNLKNLTFCDQKIDNESLTELFKNFKYIPHLEELNLNEDLIGNNGVIELSKYIFYLTNLTSLHLNSIKL